MEILKITNLQKIYPLEGEIVEALKGISFNVYKGEFLVIMGPSGSGKSTLLNILGGIDKKAQGEVIYQDKNILKYKEKEIILYRQNAVGVIFQNFNLLENASVLENIQLQDLLLRKKPFESVDSLLKEFSIDDLKNNRVDVLSEGEKQKVAIARAVVVSPEIIIADEITANLDVKNSELVIQLLERLISEKNKTVMQE